MGHRWLQWSLSCHLQKMLLWLWALAFTLCPEPQSSMALESPQRHTLSVVQDLKLLSFLAGKLRSHLIARSHFTDEETRPRSVKFVSLQYCQRMRDGTGPSEQARSIPFILTLCEAVMLKLKFKMPNSFASMCFFQFGKLLGFKC